MKKARFFSYAILSIIVLSIAFFVGACSQCVEYILAYFGIGTGFCFGYVLGVSFLLCCFYSRRVERNGHSRKE